MASSNRNWPSMFRSKPCNHHQWQHDINQSLTSSGCYRPPYSTGPGGEERSPEPKPRWNPKPEQIRILEAIFNSGMVNPPRDEIRRIRAQLQEYGQVGDANVFYWFQNRKSRSKHKLRHQGGKQQPQQTTTNTTPPPSSSSSSSEKSSPQDSTPITTTAITNTTKRANISSSSSTFVDSPTGSVNQTGYFPSPNEYLNDSFLFSQPGFGGFPTEMGDMNMNMNMIGGGVSHQHQQQQMGPCTSLLLSEIMNNNNGGGGGDGLKRDNNNDGDKMMNMMKMQFPNQMNYPLNNISLPLVDPTVPSTMSHIQGMEESSGGGVDIPPMKSTVFINDVAFEINHGPFNVREAFGEDAVLINSSGHPLLVDEWGVTLQPLQHGAFYYLI